MKKVRLQRRIDIVFAETSRLPYSIHGWGKKKENRRVIYADVFSIRFVRSFLKWRI